MSVVNGLSIEVIKNGKSFPLKLNRIMSSIHRIKLFHLGSCRKEIKTENYLTVTVHNCHL